MINVIPKNELVQRWYIYNGTVEIDGPFASKFMAYEAAKIHETRQPERNAAQSDRGEKP
jgi:hypothetical protein